MRADLTFKKWEVKDVSAVWQEYRKGTKTSFPVWQSHMGTIDYLGLAHYFEIETPANILGNSYLNSKQTEQTDEKQQVLHLSQQGHKNNNQCTSDTR